MRKTFKWLTAGLLFVNITLTSCTDSTCEAITDIQTENKMSQKYLECSDKSIVSVLDIALGKTTITRAEECVMGLSEADAEYLTSLDDEGLMDLKSQIMTQWDIQSEEEIDSLANQAYENLCEYMDAEEFIKFDNFVSEYLEMPKGLSSLESFEAFNSSSMSPEFEDIYINAALCIDNYGRILYNNILDTRATETECKKYFAARIALTSVNMLAGMILGGGPIVAVITVCDVAGATADYYRCIKNK